MGTRISSRSDLDTYVANSVGGLEAERHGKAIVDALLAEDHPPWGEDWSEWLGSTITAAFLRDVTEEPRGVKSDQELSRIYREAFESHPQRQEDPALALASAYETLCEHLVSGQKGVADEEALTWTSETTPEVTDPEQCEHGFGDCHTCSCERFAWAEGTGLDVATVESLTHVSEAARARGFKGHLPANDIGAWALALEEEGLDDLAKRVREVLSEFLGEVVS